MAIIDDLRLAGLIDADEYGVLSRVDPATVADAHAAGYTHLRALILLHACFQTKGFRDPLPPPLHPEADRAIKAPA